MGVILRDSLHFVCLRDLWGRISAQLTALPVSMRRGGFSVSNDKTTQMAKYVHTPSSQSNVFFLSLFCLRLRWPSAFFRGYLSEWQTPSFPLCISQNDTSFPTVMDPASFIPEGASALMSFSP